MEDEREGRRAKVKVLIEKAIDSTQPEVDPRLLKAIKSVVRYSDSELRLAAHTLMDLMKRDHSQVRYLSLLIIDQLFMRSKLFRSLVVENMDKLLSLSVGFRINQPLPAPPAVAIRLRSTAIEFLEKWNDSFGLHYRQLRLGFEYLKNTLRLQFPNLQANAARLQQERRERERRSKVILLNKYETLRESFPFMKDEIQSTINEIGECLDIVQSGREQVVLDSVDEEDFDEFRCIEMQQIRLSTLKEGEKVRENSDNKVVFDALRELYKLVTTKHLVSVQDSIDVLVKVELPDYKFRDSVLKELIDLTNRLRSVKRKCEEAGFAVRNTGNDDEEEEDIWEEPKVGSTESRSSGCCEGNEDRATTSTSNKVKKSDPASSSKGFSDKKMLGCEGGRTKSNPLKSKLLAEAPVVNWGAHLDNWGLKRDVLANQRGLEFESHWGRVDYDALIPADKIAELTVQATVYREACIDIQPCCAPLRKGGLCQRRDLKVCPFHGPIIPRDNEGKPIDQDPSKDETNSDSDTDLAEKLARQAVKNVRERDKEATRKKLSDKKELQRAKRMKIREHNEAVLKDAALASTSRSAAIGEDIETTNTRNKKQSLSSMLQKKVTAKDRISRRLLNTRTSEATVFQLTLGEDANYREAFPNQW